ncbi:molybdopterin molybdenumtransferase MoeA [Anaerobacillus arseniciselenatis]|uniref:Molybdopterin molybdenumtransferase n=1 Tax=Anaerobacillus arseniciselenatis TaxID=85682 RepID=A0A1S2LH53_9BACI|nr:gephyrin-like molybdotransferase Glp [Anaerobacillus arseniciselenatis]OIJ11644.1 molybdopterin molybdenumtransferase MoeA [Anaerobacillus arseniciselenatis]
MQFFKVKTVEETFAQIEELVKAVKETEVIPLEEAFRRVLAEEIIATESIPSFPRSTVDGYAVKAKETFGSSETMPGFLNVAGSVQMGEAATAPLQSGEAIYVPTGGMIPPQSDSVIMIEHCEDLNGLLNTYKQVAPGENIIQIGEDVRVGEVLIENGTKLRPQELGAIAAIGKTHVTVFKQLTVGYLSSGDEIVPYTTEYLEIGQVRDVNALTITSLVQEWGAKAVYAGIVTDDYDEYQKRAKELFEQVDCLVLSGGSSVGAKDFTTQVIESLGEPGVFIHGVSIKPGKPTILSMANEKPVIGLPGHPASAMIIFSLFGEKIVQKLSGEASRNKLDRVQVRLMKNIHSSMGRTDYVRVKLLERDGEWWAEPIIGKSGLISTLVQSDAMVEIEAENEGARQGDLVPAILLR